MLNLQKSLKFITNNDNIPSVHISLPAGIIDENCFSIIMGSGEKKDENFLQEQ